MPLSGSLSTGSDITIILEKQWLRIGKSAVIQAGHAALSANGDKMKFSWQYKCNVIFRDLSITRMCYVNLNLLIFDWFDLLEIDNKPLNAIYDESS